MADNADEAQAIEQRLLDKRINAALPPARQGSEFCADCGGRISEARRRAMPQATRCIGCQETAEDGGRR